MIWHGTSVVMSVSPVETGGSEDVSTAPWGPWCPWSGLRATAQCGGPGPDVRRQGCLVHLGEGVLLSHTEGKIPQMERAQMGRVAPQ